MSIINILQSMLNSDNSSNSILQYHDELEDYILLPNWNIMNILDIPTAFCINAIFEVSNVYFHGDNSYCHLFLLSKKRSKYIKTSIFRGKDNAVNYSLMETVFSSDYKQYLSRIDSWLKTGLQPENSNAYEFTSVKRDIFKKDKPYSKYFAQSNNNTRHLIEESIRLSEVATIIRPSYKVHPTSDSICAKTIDMKQATYIIDDTKAIGTEEESTDIVLKENDILLYNKAYYLLTRLPEYQIQAPLNTVVIRTNDNRVSAKYLFIYLNGFDSQEFESIKELLNLPCAPEGVDIGVKIFTFQPWGKCTFSDYGLDGTPILLPKNRLEIEKEFDTFVDFYPSKPTHSSPMGRTHFSDAAISKYINNTSRLVKNQKAQMYFQMVLEEVILCYNNKTYFASVVLARSLLEALVTDWLGELHSKNYFQKGLKIPIVIEDKVQKYRYATLKEYIEALHNALGSSWEKEYKLADKIRDIGNRIHPNHSIRSTEFSKEECLDVIVGLKEILLSRWQTMFS